jgi:(1->4)-alpha-D-glucan 1-alpha-D-glucosylmutase
MNPRATYRLQFHKGFTFADAAAEADYFAALGVSHIYASPILTARAGSLHGYDVIDHGSINPELGGEEGFRVLAHALRRNGLGLILDIVPNHVAVGKADNCWWLDILAKGPASRYANWFDIDWDAPGLEGKVLAPFLGAEPQEALRKGELRLVRGKDGWAFAYYDHRFPLRPEDQGSSLENLSANDLETLLGRQHFVLAPWREANRRINWRRFFDITDLAAIRSGEPDVFEAVHRKIFALYAEGWIDGVRVDHVDGLADPGAYCRMLRQRLDALRPGAVIYVEKILADGEALPADWPVEGTTGYDFLEEVSALLHHADGGRMSDLWRAASGRALDFEAEESLARRQMLESKFASQWDATARAFAPLLERDRAATKTVLAELLIRLRCYRSYATGRKGAAGPGAFLEAAVARAAQDNVVAAADGERVLAIFRHEDGDPAVIDAVRRFSQLSAPLAAKSVEDTGFYRYGRLLSRNDVGTNPRRHRMEAEEFHIRMQRRAAASPQAMLTTATHDHKRGEDARARLSILSLHPGLWEEFAAGVPRVAGLAGGDLYQLLQTLVGAWPAAPDTDFADRIAGWCVKFLREEKLSSSWAAPDEAYEARFCAHARALILDRAHADFRARLEHFLSLAGPDMRAACLAQTVLRYTVPGMPDLYQGCEWEDLSLVDPDNRRPVDFNRRRQALADGGSDKQFLIRHLLAARRKEPKLWRQGDYRPVLAPPALAFTRCSGGRGLMVIARTSGTVPPGEIALPFGGEDLFTQNRFQAGPVALARLITRWPAAVLLGPAP